MNSVTNVSDLLQQDSRHRKSPDGERPLAAVNFQVVTATSYIKSSLNRGDNSVIHADSCV